MRRPEAVESPIPLPWNGTLGVCLNQQGRSLECPDWLKRNQFKMGTKKWEEFSNFSALSNSILSCLYRNTLWQHHSENAGCWRVRGCAPNVERTRGGNKMEKSELEIRECCFLGLDPLTTEWGRATQRVYTLTIKRLIPSRGRFPWQGLLWWRGPLMVPMGQ